MFDHLWDFLEFLANLDVRGDTYNIFSISTFILMFVIGTYKFYKMEQDPDPYKRVLKTVILSGSALALYYTLVDRISGLTFGLFFSDIVDRELFELSIFLNFPFPSVILTVPITYYFAIRIKKVLPLRVLLVVLIQILWILITVAIFGDWNMRSLGGGDIRTIFYVTNFIPMWIFWCVGYVKTFNPRYAATVPENGSSALPDRSFPTSRSREGIWKKN